LSITPFKPKLGEELGRGGMMPKSFKISPANTCSHCRMMNHEELGMMQVVEVYADN
jgi:hypothetical protein